MKVINLGQDKFEHFSSLDDEDTDNILPQLNDPPDNDVDVEDNEKENDEIKSEQKLEPK